MHATLLLSMPLVAGCALLGPRAALPISARDSTLPLLSHPQFPQAAKAAPDFVQAALDTITRLDREAADHGH